ncbi:hypothetical protein GE061_009677 [Apolygus lucorum]|uniref:Xaa-Pro dipeptidase n=1 Tax=Apolygus lucorum TaxID=248454 RepID=A0A6A4KDI6_APOLU|nr:hypothetical protein GE061_009677 [Apolygus lucorum]
MAGFEDLNDSCLQDATFKTANELRSIRESKGNRGPELLKESAANQLYYQACPLDDMTLDRVLEYIDEFANEKEAKDRTWIAKGLDKYTKCKFKEPSVKQQEEQESVRSSGSARESFLRSRLDSDLVAFYRTLVRDGSKLTYIDDVAMENLLRARADVAKEKMRLQQYKQHMKRFLKVYKLLQGGELDYSDALKMINTANVREGYTSGLRDHKETSSYWELSRQSFPVKMETFAVNRRRLLRELSAKYSRAVVLLRGGEEIYQYDSTEKYEFRQEPFFLWTFGATEPNLWGLLDCWTGRSVLLCQRLPDDKENDYNRRKMGMPILQELKAKYEVDQVTYFDQMEEILMEFSPVSILILSGINEDSGRPFPSITVVNDVEIDVDDLCLYGIMSELRSIKTNFELDLVRYASKITSLAHRLMMKRITADSYEYQAAALFKFFVNFVGGCGALCGKSICSSGHNTSDPDYSANTRLIKCGEMVVFDMGASFYGYGSSVACTIPVGGLFNLEQKTIYNIVLRARNVALENIKAGVFWSEIHEQGVKALLSGLVEIGVLQGDVDEMLNVGVSNVFMPFGIGHFIGLDRFDVGGFTESSPEKRGSSKHLQILRTLRMLKPGMVMVLQVGCYFIPQDIVAATADQLVKEYFVKEKINRFLNLGGIFIKDNIIVTHQGYEMLTDLPRTVHDIENWIAGKYNDNFNFGFTKHDNENKDEMWIGAKKNPCVDDAVHNRT